MSDAITYAGPHQAVFKDSNRLTVQCDIRSPQQVLRLYADETVIRFDREMAREVGEMLTRYAETGILIPLEEHAGILEEVVIEPTFVTGPPPKPCEEGCPGWCAYETQDHAPPDGLILLQKCDDCRHFKTDLEAAEHAHATGVAKIVGILCTDADLPFTDRKHMLIERRMLETQIQVLEELRKKGCLAVKFMRTKGVAHERADTLEKMWLTVSPIIEMLSHMRDYFKYNDRMMVFGEQRIKKKRGR